jgi:hypothetical protein
VVARVDPAPLLGRPAPPVLPVSGTPRPPLSECTGSPEHVAALFRSLAPCRAVTLLGLHSISVPVEAGRNMQVVARRGGLAAALRHACRLEATPV